VPRNQDRAHQLKTYNSQPESSFGAVQPASQAPTSLSPRQPPANRNDTNSLIINHSPPGSQMDVYPAPRFQNVKFQPDYAKKEPETNVPNTSRRQHSGDAGSFDRAMNISSSYFNVSFTDLHILANKRHADPQEQSARCQQHPNLRNPAYATYGAAWRNGGRGKRLRGWDCAKYPEEKRLGAVLPTAKCKQPDPSAGAQEVHAGGRGNQTAVPAPDEPTQSKSLNRQRPDAEVELLPKCKCLLSRM